MEFYMRIGAIANYLDKQWKHIFWACFLKVVYENKSHKHGETKRNSSHCLQIAILQNR